MSPGLIILLSVGGLLLSSAAAVFVLVRLPKDYYTHPRKRDVRPDGPKWWAKKIARNLLGVVVLVLGVTMLALPGPGLVTIFIGLMLVDFPKRYLVERWLIRKPRVNRGINWVRKRFHKELIKVPD